jgi:hypothetical protein
MRPLIPHKYPFLGNETSRKLSGALRVVGMCAAISTASVVCFLYRFVWLCRSTLPGEPDAGENFLESSVSPPSGRLS